MTDLITGNGPSYDTAAAFFDGIPTLVLARDDDIHRIHDYAETHAGR